ncbi:MAG: hypothetical protein JO089_05505, partial [Alphaproteobacteria bacterium]|nr:hypothetical protein [Alphaproteobacteria bacterium]
MIDGLTDKTFRMPIQRIIAPTEVKSGFGSEAPHRLEYWQVSGESPYPVQERYGFANAAGP